MRSPGMEEIESFVYSIIRLICSPYAAWFAGAAVCWCCSVPAWPAWQADFLDSYALKYPRKGMPTHYNIMHKT